VRTLYDFNGMAPQDGIHRDAAMRRRKRLRHIESGALCEIALKAAPHFPNKDALSTHESHERELAHRAFPEEFSHELW
jgi:hypothetical protein